MSNWVELINRKKEGDFLESEEIEEFLNAFQRDEIAPEQASAFLMAAVLNGLDDEETEAFTKTLIGSGQVLGFKDLGYPPVDLAETGGVGGNGALVAIPIAASYGAKLPIIGERSLGIFGGLLDRLETIPGFRTDIGLSEFQENVRAHGIAIAGQTQELTPTEIKMSQLRANTGCLGGAELTTASLLALKASAGVRGLVIEIACGSGGLVADPKEARRLADCLATIGERLGIHITGCITNRDNPLGQGIGDVLELTQAIDTLRGGGPDDYKEVALDLAASLLMIGQLSTDHAQGLELANKAIADGRAFEKLKEIVAHQGGDTLTLENPENLPRSQGKREILTQRAGHVKAIDSKLLGKAWMHLGGSRAKRGDSCDHRVGVEIHKKVGDAVSKGEPLVTLYTSERSQADDAIEAVEEAYLLSPDPTDKQRAIVENFGRYR
ncbi:MAG: thymidine phosphorylase [Candidatus Omnitrophica bacterium]|nr:thymidine phosphorylase [Candidatus Omnitrophota bacterium]MCA9416367.1 thymidine phosphorylase [Candidatus Omnitrophota bacterium]MCA9424448.1 thymidine phosphorylase [Candidatus Omnitrophota bacterium]MCA9435449.1 thymidine phosphorylase [Candidatus Omnitrophota bacterium]MCA9440583.1 thymidine phosphorylase [Candidatus Omnitrophota bacterium]